MDSKYADLFNQVTFPNGASVKNRFAMAPMVINSSNPDGTVTQGDIDYFQRRSKTGGMLISAACYVDIMAQWMDNQYGIFSDKHIAGMTKMATAMKSNGAKAIMQIFHTGREADVAYRDYGVAYGPSSMTVSFLDHPITGMSERKIEDVIGYFGDATRRAIEAGFDGVEIHGANHYLIQQFFSKFSNHRTDKWGGSIEKRAAFGLAVLDEVKRVAKIYAKPDFIIGYRFSPEEIHGDNVGYTLDDSLYLVEQLIRHGVDYIHSSLWGNNSYKRTAQLGEHEGAVINQVIKDKINGRCPLIIVGDISNPEKTLDAARYGNILARGASCIVEPDMVEKIANNHIERITYDVKGRLEELKIPYGVKSIMWILKSSGSIPEETLDELKALKLPDDFRVAESQRMFS